MANIIITGASNGIGFETALELLENPKNNVIALARSVDKLTKLQDIAGSLHPDGGKLYAAKFDIVYDDYQNSLVPFIQGKFDKVDVLINNAGLLVNKPFLETSLEDFSEVFQTNYIGAVRMIQHIVPLMRENAHIVNISSMGGYQGSAKFPGLSAYSSSKAAIANLTECLAEEFKEKKVNVNCLALGSVQTEMFEQAFPDAEAGVLAFEMGQYIADFALKGNRVYNGKVLPVANTTP